MGHIGQSVWTQKSESRWSEEKVSQRLTKEWAEAMVAGFCISSTSRLPCGLDSVALWRVLVYVPSPALQGRGEVSAIALSIRDYIDLLVVSQLPNTVVLTHSDFVVVLVFESMQEMQPKISQLAFSHGVQKLRAVTGKA